MNHGTRPLRIDHRDYDFHKTFGAVSPTFPDSYSTENGLWIPNQEAPEPFFGNPALPYGCTDYTQADLDNDIIGKLLANPSTLDNLTHANAMGGIDIRTALKGAIKLGWIQAFYNIQPHSLDWFDTIRYAILSGVPEKRSVSWGTPWIFEDVNGIVQPPNLELIKSAPWHNSKLCGWKTINGSPYLINKSWQGTSVGDNGFLYFSRDIVNQIMSISGTCAFTATKNQAVNPQTIDTSILEWVISNIRNFLNFSY